MFNRGSSMVRNQQLMTSHHAMCVMLPSLLLFITSFSMDIKADTTIELAGTNPITQEETLITSSKTMTNDLKNDKSSQQKSASTAIPKPSNVVNQPMVTNDSGVLNEGKAISTLDLDDTKPLKTFNYSVHNFVVVKPVTGLANHSQNIVTRLKQLYISYKQNYTSPFYSKDSEEKVEINYQSKNAEDSAEVVIEEDMNEYYHAEFERWNNRRLMDGLLCQNDSQCEWLDWKLRCKTDIELNFDINESWYDDLQPNSTLGVCFCLVYHVWSEQDMECWHPEAPPIPPPWAIAIAVGVVLLLIVKLAIVFKLMI